jgi:hypothetical protein
LANAAPLKPKDGLNGPPTYYAEGQFENAVETQQLVISLVPPDKKAEYNERLNMYMRTLEASKREVRPRSTFPDR